MQQSNLRLSPIQPHDNPTIASIIRQCLEEYGANKPGTVYYDAETDHLYELFQTQGSVYFVARINEEVLGGAGLFPSKGLPVGTVELVKMYLLPEGRGLGIGKMLMEKCLKTASEMGYEQIYLETMPELVHAIPMYEKYGFKYLNGALGNTGHFGCDLQMIRNL